MLRSTHCRTAGLHHLSLVCAKLGITLIHARAYQPQSKSKGKQERWFRTVRMQLVERQ